MINIAIKVKGDHLASNFVEENTSTVEIAMLILELEKLKQEFMNRNLDTISAEEVDYDDNPD